MLVKISALMVHPLYSFLLLFFLLPPSSVVYVSVLLYHTLEKQMLVPPELAIIYLTPLKNVSIIAFLYFYVNPVTLGNSISLYISYFPIYSA